MRVSLIRIPDTEDRLLLWVKLCPPPNSQIDDLTPRTSHGNGVTANVSKSIVPKWSGPLIQNSLVPSAEESRALLTAWFQASRTATVACLSHSVV